MFCAFPPLAGKLFSSAVIALIALSPACSDSAPAPRASASPDPSVISHEARLDADNGQTVFASAVLSAPARAAVEYENEFAGELRGPDSDFDFPDPTDRFTMQHTASELPDGNILVFDNRAKLPEEEGGERRSRALELRLDFDAKTAVKAWEFSPEPRMYSRFIGSAYRLDNGNTLINFGFSPDFASIPIAIVEVDARGREAFRLASIDPPLSEYWGPNRYRVYPGPKSIMGETMLRAPRR